MTTAEKDTLWAETISYFTARNIVDANTRWNVVKLTLSARMFKLPGPKYPRRIPKSVREFATEEIKRCLDNVVGQTRIMICYEALGFALILRKQSLIDEVVLKLPTKLDGSLITEEALACVDTEYRRLYGYDIATGRRQLMLQGSNISTNVAALLNVAERIRAERKPCADNKPLPIVQKSLFTCKRKNGEVFEAVPSQHAISQFAWRYTYINKNYIAKSNVDIVRSMGNIFVDCKRKSDKAFVARNQKHHNANTIMYWGNHEVTFVIDVIKKVVVTFELAGKLGKYNNQRFNKAKSKPSVIEAELKPIVVPTTCEFAKARDIDLIEEQNRYFFNSLAEKALKPA